MRPPSAQAGPCGLALRALRRCRGPAMRAVCVPDLTRAHGACVRACVPRARRCRATPSRQSSTRLLKRASGRRPTAARSSARPSRCAALRCAALPCQLRTEGGRRACGARVPATVAISSPPHVDRGHTRSAAAGSREQASSPWLGDGVLARGAQGAPRAHFCVPAACLRAWRACVAAQGVRVVLTDGAAHSVDSNELAFRIASVNAFRQVHPPARLPTHLPAAPMRLHW